MDFFWLQQVALGKVRRSKISEEFLTGKLATMTCASPEIIDPVEAYDRIAPIYGDLSRDRRAYLEKIEDLVVAHIPKGVQSLLDIGAGDGKRAVRIARAAGIGCVILLEPSAKMREGADASSEIWPIRAEELSPQENKFDMITCLWNVLGHISGENRVDVLKRCGEALSPEGFFFLDVNHRYNIKAYGLWPTSCRILYDWIFPSVGNGDVVMEWKGQGFRTYGHVFTQHEMRDLIDASGLKIVEKIFVNYRSGKIETSSFNGNLFYVLRRNA